MRYTGFAAAGMVFFFLHGAYQMLQAFAVSVLYPWRNKVGLGHPILEVSASHKIRRTEPVVLLTASVQLVAKAYT